MIISLTIEKVSTRCWWAGLLFCTIYNSYRYPLQINSSGTSPTYSDTPISFQLAKFVVVLLLCLVAIVFVPSKPLRYNRWFLAGFLAYLSLFPILKGFLSDRTTQLEYLEIAFWPLAALILSLAAGPVSVDSLNRYFRFVFIYTLLSTVLEVSLFFLIGRLPALAYRGSIAVRFGGFLDDPNGFPALLYMLMAWAYYRYAGWRCVLAEAALVLCLLLTQSFTALLFFVPLALLLIGYQIVRGPRRILVMSLCATTVFALIPILPQLNAVASDVVALKSKSIDQHTAQNAIPLGSTLEERLLGDEVFLPYESWWIGSLHNFGLLWWSLNSVAVLAILLLTVSRFLRTSDSGFKPVLAAIALLSIYFVAGNVNLPFFTVFPINFIFFCLSYLVLFGRITGLESEPGRASDVAYVGTQVVMELNS